jgi:hypothetical protein
VAEALSARAQRLLAGTARTPLPLPRAGYNSGGETIEAAAARL